MVIDMTVEYEVMTDPDRGCLCFFSTANPKHKDKIARWNMKLKNRDIHKIELYGRNKIIIGHIG